MKNKEDKFLESIANSFLEYSKIIISERMIKTTYCTYRTIYIEKK